MKKTWILGTICIFTMLILVLLSHSISASRNSLKEYENSVIHQLSENGVLYDSSQLNAVLDMMEDYLEANKNKLLIWQYVRYPDSISIEFWYGTSYLILPRVYGMK